MNKPLTMAIKEVNTKLIDACNESGLPPIILDLIVYKIYSEIHALADKQSSEEELAYMKTIKDIDSANADLKQGDCYEQEKENGNK